MLTDKEASCYSIAEAETCSFLNCIENGGLGKVAQTNFYFPLVLEYSFCLSTSVSFMPLPIDSSNYQC